MGDQEPHVGLHCALGLHPNAPKAAGQVTRWPMCACIAP